MNKREETMEFQTCATVGTLGRAMVIDLRDAGLETKVVKPHMTLFFERVYNAEEVKEVQTFVDNYKASILKSPVVKFTTSPWGAKSDYVHGELETLCLTVRKEFPNLSKTEQRVPHVALRL